MQNRNGYSNIIDLITFTTCH